MSEKMHALYRFYGDTGQLLYVGITADPGKRFGQHRATKNWWEAVRGISLEWYHSREELEDAEKRAIRVEHPLFNTQRRAPGPVADKRCGHCTNCVENDGGCFVYTPRLPDEDPAEPCAACGSTTCLYDFGRNEGLTDGYWAGASAATNMSRGGV